MKFYDMTTPKKPVGIENKNAHIIGSGIAGLSAAVYLIQDAGMPGKILRSMNHARILAAAWRRLEMRKKDT